MIKALLDWIKRCWIWFLGDKAQDDWKELDPGVTVPKDLASEVHEGRPGFHELWARFYFQKEHDHEWLTVPRVFMHDMPDEWQLEMARLLQKMDDTFYNAPKMQTAVSIKIDTKYAKMPEWMDWQNPDHEVLDGFKHKLTDLGDEHECQAVFVVDADHAERIKKEWDSLNKPGSVRILPGSDEVAPMPAIKPSKPWPRSEITEGK